MISQAHYFISTKEVLNDSNPYTCQRRKNRTTRDENLGIPKETTRIKVDVKMPGVAYKYFQYNDAVDRHNRNRADIGLEKTHKTTRRDQRVFTTLLACSFVDSYKFYLGSRKKDNSDKSRHEKENVLTQNAFLKHLGIALASYTSAEGRQTRAETTNSNVRPPANGCKQQRLKAAVEEKKKSLLRISLD